MILNSASPQFGRILPEYRPDFRTVDSLQPRGILEHNKNMSVGNMAQQRENIKVLRALVEKPAIGYAAGEGVVRLGHGVADTALGGGLNRFALHEVFAAEAGEEAPATGFALAAATRVSAKNKWLLWVRQDFSALEAGELHACGLLEFGIDPSRLLTVRAPDATEVLRAGAEGLGCKGLGAAIIEPWGEPKAFDLVASRKLTLAAQQHGVAAIMLRLGAKPEPSTAETRWLVKAAVSAPGNENWGKPLFDAALVRNRHGCTGRWVMEWDCNDGIFRQTHSCAPAAAPSYGSAATPMEGLRQAG
jgi:protein ImuA